MDINFKNANSLLETKGHVLFLGLCFRPLGSKIITEGFLCKRYGEEEKNKTKQEFGCILPSIITLVRMPGITLEQTQNCSPRTNERKDFFVDCQRGCNFPENKFAFVVAMKLFLFF